MKVLIVHGPNLNNLGQRDPTQYGSMTLAEIDAALAAKAAQLGVEIACFQSNHEGALIDFIQDEGEGADGIVINPGALTHYGLSLRDALEDFVLSKKVAGAGREGFFPPVIEVHLSNVYAREPFRHRSLIAPVVGGQVSGLGWRGYLVALEALVIRLKEEGSG